MIVLHGGPAAVGEATPLARGLARRCRVLEPWQRGHGEERLTVARHIADLHEVVKTRCPDERPALVGESWGAMLALAYAAAHPDDAGPIVLVGCGTFDPVARARMLRTLDERMTEDLRRELKRLQTDLTDPDERLGRMYELMLPLYHYDPIAVNESEPKPATFDARAHTETWEDMLRLQADGVYPGTFSVIRSPLLMLHGVHDPHPGRMIRDSLVRHLTQLEYREWDHCGHQPWLEREVRDEFFSVLRGWLADKLNRPGEKTLPDEGFVV